VNHVVHEVTLVGQNHQWDVFDIFLCFDHLASIYERLDLIEGVSVSARVHADDSIGAPETPG
jgi:hypothetical protein